MLPLMFSLVAAHFVCDFVLQGDTMAREKSPHSTTALQLAVPWYYWLIAHSLTHGAAVAVLLHSAAFGLAEAVMHFLIDLAKCNQRINIHVDLALHLACKELWIVLFAFA